MCEWAVMLMIQRTFWPQLLAASRYPPRHSPPEASWILNFKHRLLNSCLPFLEWSLWPSLFSWPANLAQIKMLHNRWRKEVSE